jgi:hypothetical protein
MKKHTIEQLNELFTDGENSDRELFAEQRSNVLLIAGDHYTRKGSRYWNRIRDNKDLSNDQKLRLTKNHIGKITKTYQNNIVGHNPGVNIVPKNEKEIQDKKSAELNKAVWEDAWEKYDLDEQIQTWAKDFVDLGEVFVKITWNPNKGRLLGDIPKLDERGQVVISEDGTPEITGQQYSGAFEFERLFSFNMVRNANAKSSGDTNFWCHRKMVDIDTLKAMVGQDEQKLKLISETVDKTFLVFDGANGTYTRSPKGQAMIREYYFKPCMQYPDGYFYITTEGGILFEDVLPFGIYPIKCAGFDDIQTSARARSIVKQLRPYQAEINRSASKIAEHQVTLGDDKLLVQSGTKVTNGGTLPGVRTLQYSGLAPTILQGRSGEQYLNYMSSQISEMYQISNVAEDSQEDDKVNADPYGSLFASLKNKKKFKIYSNKFEKFLTNIAELYLELARHYIPDDELIPAVGRSEAINIAEFKNAEPMGYQIKVIAQSHDIEEMWGKQLLINHTMQYNGNKLDRQDIGRLIRASPFGNMTEIFEDFTMDYDIATNLLLALDRGENPGVGKYDDNTYMIRRLTSRMRSSDFRLLDPDIQHNYDMYVSQYEQLEADKQRQILAAQSEYIPTEGALVKADYYVSTPDGKSQRVVIPARALEWLVQRLADQGTSMNQMSALPTQAQADTMGQVVQGGTTGMDLSAGKEAGKINQQAAEIQGRPTQSVPPNMG